MASPEVSGPAETESGLSTSDQEARLVQGPSDIDAVSSLARSLHTHGFHVAAADWFRRLAALSNSTSAEGRLNAAISLAMVGEEETATQSLTLLVGLVEDAITPAAADLVARCAAKALDSGAEDSAETIVRKLTALHPALELTFILEARLARRRGDLESGHLRLRRLQAISRTASVLTDGVNAVKGLLPVAEIQALLRRIICHDPSHADGMAQLFHVTSRSGRSEAVRHGLRTLALLGNGSVVEILVAAGVAAILFVKDRPDAAMAILNRFPEDRYAAAGAASGIVYARFVRRLIDWWRHNPADCRASLPEIQYIGDSHSLSAHGVITRWRGQDHRIQAHCLVGQTAHSIARGIGGVEISERLKGCRSSAPVIFGFGEVDCRMSGHLVTERRQGGSAAFESVTARLAGRLVDTLMELAAEQHVVGCLGVPAPRAGHAGAAQMSELHQVIKSYNAALDSACRRRGIAFIDVYGTSAASAFAHIDDYHLVPSVIAEALRHKLAEEVPA